MRVTQEIVKVYQDAPGLQKEGLQAVLDHLTAKGLLLEPFDPEAWDGQEEPPVGYRVVDKQADVWSHGDYGWGCKSDDATGFDGDVGWLAVRSFAPLALVPGGPVPRDRW